MYILQSDPELKELFPNPPLVAYGRDTPLGDLILHSRILSSPPGGTTFGTCPYGKAKCKMCDHVCSATSFRGPRWNFAVNLGFACESENVIYVIICSACSSPSLMLYIGELGRTLAMRADEHLRSARLGYENPVGQHFPSHGNDALSICGIWKCKRGVEFRRFKEMEIAQSLGTFHPTGMNIRS